MRPLLILSAVLAVGTVPATAQVTVNLHALQALPERPAASRPSVPRATAAAPAQAAAPTLVQAAPQAAAPAPAPDLPESVPPVASITPPGAPETAAQATAAAPPVAQPQAGQPPAAPVLSGQPPVLAAPAAAPVNTRLRLAFGPGKSDIAADDQAAIKQLIASAPPGDNTTFTVLAYAPGSADDPSTARRISLARATAVRAALTGGGIPSARVFVRALGAQYGDGPPDRADIDVTAER